MTSKEIPGAQLLPTSIEVDEIAGTVTIVMPLQGYDVYSESGKMEVLCTSNGWKKTAFVHSARSAKPIDVQIFVGTRA